MSNYICDHYAITNERSSCALGKYFMPSESVCTLRCKFRTVDGAPLPPKPILRAAKEYIQVEVANIVKGNMKEEDVERRHTACLGCKMRAVRYMGMEAKDEFGWCTACGCGTAKRALLLTKIRMPTSECPMALWGNEAKKPIDL